MAKLVWAQSGERTFELGVDRGVFFPQNDKGVPWNGLVNVSESPDGGEATPYYIDGIKFLNVPSPEDFAGSIEALSYPREFIPYDGMGVIASGLFIDQQPRRSFGFAYRTKIGNDTVGENFRYKIHLVYNVLVTPSEKAYDTIKDSVDPVVFNWDFTTTPMVVPDRRPSAHMVIESLHEEFVTAIEDLIYGTTTVDPALPSPTEVVNLYNSIMI